MNSLHNINYNNMGWFIKSEKERQVDLQKECDKLNELYKNYFDKFCIIDDNIFIFNYFSVKDDVIKIHWNDITIPQDRSYSMKYSWFQSQYGDDVIKKSRNKFINIKHQLDIYGYKIFKKEINGK